MGTNDFAWLLITTHVKTYRLSVKLFSNGFISSILFIVNLNTFSQWIFCSWWRRLIPERFLGVEWQKREFANLTRRVQLIYSRALIEMVARRREGHFVGMPLEKSFLDLLPDNIEKNEKLCKPNKCLWLIPNATWITTPNLLLTWTQCCISPHWWTTCLLPRQTALLTSCAGHCCSSRKRATSKSAYRTNWTLPSSLRTERSTRLALFSRSAWVSHSQWPPSGRYSPKRTSTVYSYVL